jgi:hypothetical protein
MPPFVQARRDASLSAVVLNCTPLLYSEGADLPGDRPGHVRAGSSLSWIGERLALVQDDANFLALVDPRSGRVDAVCLPCGEGGARQFDDLRGTKHLKLDLEACVAVPCEQGEMLLALGSGSTPRRETIAAITLADASHVTLHYVPKLYQLLRERTEFSGSALNIEGAILVEGCLRLFNRGNGAPCGEMQPVNATAEFSWSEFSAWLEENSLAPPQPDRIVQYDLGEIAGTRLGFTDAAQAPGALLFSAAAENSRDAVCDGPVTGSAIGVFDSREQLRWIELRTTAGEIFPGKVEGICAARETPGRLYAVVDVDNPRHPSELCEIEIRGRWRS